MIYWKFPYIQKNYDAKDIEPNSRKKETAQHYKTPKGRIVYGGGGIQPDVTMASEKKTVPKALRPLYSNDENIFFKFADNYVISQQDLSTTQDLETFAREFIVRESLWRQFRQFVLEHHTSKSISASVLDSNAGFLKDELKIELAGRLWGDRGRFASIIMNDSQVLSCLKYFEQAESLLRK